MSPTSNPPSASRTNIGARIRRNDCSLNWSILRKTDPSTPDAIPSRINHGNCVTRVNSNDGTEYHGSMPKNMRDTIVATTEENTSGANRFIEKFPSTIHEAKTAPEMGAL